MLLALALAATALAATQEPVRVEASLASSRITAGETTVLVISVETDGPSPSDVPVPVLPPGLELGPVSDYSQLQLSFPGGRRRTTRREIVLSARAPGQYRIPAVEVDVDGTRYRTRPLELRVLPGSAAPAPVVGDAEPVRLRASARPDSVWTGEQILYEAEALFPEALRVRQARPPLFEPPASTGFWAYDLPDAVTVNLRIIDGAAYEAQTFRQVLFPLADGAYPLPPARMQYEVRQGFAFTPVRREVASQPVTVHVRPLPPAPPGFGGAVGDYTVRAELSRARVAPGEPVTLSLVVEGAGNVKALPRPELPVIEGAEVYAGAEDTRFGFADGTVSGRKTITWTVVTPSPGTTVIPAIAYTWFDPSRGEYRTGETEPLRLEATSAAPTGAPGALAPLRTDRDVARLAWTRSPLFLAAQLLPLLVLASLALLGRRRAGAAASGSGGREPGLERAAALLAEPRACLDEVARYTARFDTAEAQILRARVRQARYAPEPPTRALCEALLAEAGRLGAGTTARVHLLPLLLVAALGLASQGERAAFESGVEAYATREYDVAARAFARHLRTSSADAAAWYNLGNAWQQQAETGRATWAWLRALELRPRDRLARHNLRVAGAEHALELAPAAPLSSDELRLAAAAGWWLLVLAAALTRYRRCRAVLALALAGLLVLLPALGVLGARAVRAPRAVTVVMADLHAAPVLRAEALGVLAAGEPVTVLRQRGDWVLARARDLREGWVERRALGRL